MKNSILPLALFASGVSLVHAATTITFESPYAVGAVATATSGSPPASTSNKDFIGQQNWSDSTSNSGGNITTTTSIGSYTGGQALTASTTGTTQTYIGAKAIDSIHMTTMTSLVFDFRYQLKELGVGGWNDTDNDSLFDQSEAQFMPGVVSTSGTTFGFGLRGAGFLGSGGTYNGRFSTGAVGTVGDWYRMTVTPNSATNTVTLGVFDLSTNTAVTLATSVFSLTAAQFGVATASYDGIVARVTSSTELGQAPAAIDNIQIIPEPTAALLGGLGMLSLLRRRRD